MCDRYFAQILVHSFLIVIQNKKTIVEKSDRPKKVHNLF